MSHSEFLRKLITGIPNIANRNSNFLTLQTSEFKKKIRPESSESKTESEFRLCWGFQKLEPNTRIPNQGDGNSEVLEGAFHTQENTETWSVHHVDCLQMFPSPEASCLKKEQQHSNKGKGSSGEGHWQVSDKGEDGSNAHH
jgi:hypothetical protein